MLKMADQLKIESQEDLNPELFCEYDSSNSSSNSRCGSLEFLLTAEKESFIKEILLAEAMFPEFFVKTAVKGLGTNFSGTSLAYVMKSASRPEKRHCTLSDEAIEIWYIKEYGLVAS